MAKEKDPAFLFYSKDWLEGTADMSKEAKGVFIDLLAHQHQKKGLPNDLKKLARLASMSESEFLVIWEAEVKTKFTPNGDKTVNRKLTEVMTERATKGQRNRIIGTLASVARLCPEPYEKKKKAREGFLVDDFLTIPDQTLTESITEWFQSRLKSIEDANANTNVIVLKDRGMEKGICPGMVQTFKIAFPEYPVDQKLDFAACLEISYKIGSAKGWSKEATPIEHAFELQAVWSDLVDFAKADKWYAGRSISDFNKEFQRLFQSYNNPHKHGTAHKQAVGSPQFSPSLTSKGDFGEL